MDVKEFTISQLIPYLHSLNKYDEEEVIGGIIKKIEEIPTINYLRLRPNGIDGISSVSMDIPTIEKAIGHKWGSEYIKIIR